MLKVIKALTPDFNIKVAVKKKMGNFITREDQITDIIYDIVTTDKFNTYQEKFNNLTPSRELYIEDGELNIETIRGTSYSILKYEFNWFSPNVEDEMYKVLDKLYDTYHLYNNPEISPTDKNITFKKCDKDDCSIYLVFDKREEDDIVLRCSRHQSTDSRTDGSTDNSNAPIIKEVQVPNFLVPELGYSCLPSDGKSMGIS